MFGKRRKFKNLSGKKFARLLVIERVANRMVGKMSRVFYLCKCVCGTYKVIGALSLGSKQTRSCGCLCSEKSRERATSRRGKKSPSFKHGLRYHPLYITRTHMIQRCENQNRPSYKNYGGRGISVCKEWRESPEVFVKWGLDNGWQKGLSIDRIDNDGNYCPENCQFLTLSENSFKANEERRKKKAA